MALAESPYNFYLANERERSVGTPTLERVSVAGVPPATCNLLVIRLLNCLANAAKIKVGGDTDLPPLPWSVSPPTTTRVTMEVIRFLNSV